MRTLVLTAGVLALGQTLSTDYDAATRLRVETTTRMKLESTTEMERDGQPVEGRGGFGGAMSSNETRRVVLIDEYLEKADGAPKRVRRSFEDVSAEGQMEAGEFSNEIERESPFDGIVLELAVDDDGEVAVEVVEGSAPDDELLEGQRPTLALDALLPTGEVAVGDTWELSGEAIAQALGFDLDRALFPPQSRSDEGEGEGGRGGRGRGGFGRGGGGQPLAQLFTLGEWEGTATLESLEEEHEGQTCALIKIEIEGEGELPEPQFGGRGRGRGGFAAGPVGAARLENDFRVEGEGRLLYSIADERPVHFVIEGELSSSRLMERESERGSMSISTTSEGTFAQTVSITAEGATK